MRRTAPALGVFVAVLLGNLARADSPSGGGSLRARSPAFSWMAAAGTYNADDNPGQLDGEHGQFGLSGGLSYRMRPVFALDFEFLAYSADYDAPPAPSGPFVTISDEYNLETTAILVTARVERPAGRLRPFAGAGAGLFLAEIKRRASFLGIPGISQSEKEAVPGLSLGAGLALALTSRGSITFEYRQLFVSADFGPMTGGRVDLGGSLVLAGYRHQFP